MLLGNHCKFDLTQESTLVHFSGLIATGSNYYRSRFMPEPSGLGKTRTFGGFQSEDDMTTGIF
jgi:hypothetical protein